MFRRSDYTVNPTIENNYSGLTQNRQLIAEKYSSETNALYMLILKDAQSLQRSSEKQDKLKLCKQIQSSCDELIKKTNNIIQEIIPLEKDFEKQLIDTEAASNQVYQEINKLTSLIRDFESQHAKLTTKEKDLLDHRQKLEQNMKETEAKIKETGIPMPFLGLAGAIVLLLSNKKELEDKLVQNKMELGSIENDLKKVVYNINCLNTSIKDINLKSEQLKHSKIVTDTEIKEIAKILTKLRNIELNLKENYNHYKFVFIKDLELIKDEILEDMLNPQEILSFIESIKKIQSIKIIES